LKRTDLTARQSAPCECWVVSNRASRICRFQPHGSELLLPPHMTWWMGEKGSQKMRCFKPGSVGPLWSIKHQDRGSSERTDVEKSV
jgi:hypothetical protein